MYEPIHLNNDFLVPDRIHELQEIACELRSSRRLTGDRAGLLTRTRWSLGRRLVAFGSSLSGQGA
jgi:hypothetical protein